MDRTVRSAHKDSAPIARSDVVGSLLRPAELLAAREALSRGELTAAAFKTIEDRIMASLEPEGEVKNSASTALANLRRKKVSSQSRIIERIQSYCTGKSR